jgi:hypothetical protein
VFFNKQRLRLYLGGLLFFQFVTIAANLPYALAGKTDFRAFYTAGHMIHSGLLYDYDAEVSAQSAYVSPNRYALPFMSPAYAALPFALLARVSFRSAYWIWFTLNLCFCWIAAAIVGPFCAMLRSRWMLVIPLLFVSFMPLGTALVFGQMSLLLLLLYCASFAAVQTARPFLGGIFLSLALIKFQIALPVAILFLVWRQWRFITGFVLGAATLTLISVRITGIHGLSAYLHSLLFMAGQTSSETKYSMLSAQMPNLYGLFHTILPGRLGFILTICCSLATLAWAATRKPSLPLALVAGILVSYHLYGYDLTLLLIPISLVFNAELTARINRLALYASAFLVLASVFRFLFPSNFHYLFAIAVAVLLVDLGHIGAIPSNSVEPGPPHNLEAERTPRLLTT